MATKKIDGVPYDEGEWTLRLVESGSAYAWAMTHNGQLGHNVSVELMVHHAVCQTCKLVAYDQWATIGDPPPPPPQAAVTFLPTLSPIPESEQKPDSEHPETPPYYQPSK